MDLLKAEIERKRKAMEQAKSSKVVRRVGGGNEGGSGRYLKASDLRRFQEQQEEEAELRRRGVFGGKDRGGENEGARKRRRKYDGFSSEDGDDRMDGNLISKKDEDGDGRSSSSDEDDAEDRKAASDGGGADIPPKDRHQLRDGGDDKDSRISPTEITRFLRGLGLPIRLFGERTVDLGGGRHDDTARLGRLREARETRKAAAAGLSEMDEFRLGSGHSIRNPFLGTKRRGGVDEGLGGAAEDDVANTRAKRDSSSVIGKANSSSGGGKKGDASGATGKGKDGGGDDDGDDPHKRIYRFFKGLLRQWEDDLARRPEAIKRTTAGRNETKTVKQCKDYIRPLFKLCKKRTLEHGIMVHITKIVECCEQGEFVRAHDAYMDLAIGRAAWPMGVTMVGIHARSGREKISSSNVAHVMNSELQRKYLTSVKRLMSYYQKKRTDVDPSKKVLNM